MKMTNEQQKEFLEALKTTTRTFQEICDFLSSDEVEKTLAADKANDLVKNRKDIEELLRSEIVGRYYYQKGRIVANLKNDPDLNRAFEILLNTNGKDEYHKILGK